MNDVLSRLRTSLEGRYTVDREIGRGGMSLVFQARDLKHNRNVAIKVLRPELTASIGADRFLSEINIAANLEHPNILPLFDSGDADGLLYYSMPLVDGESLRDRINREGPLPLEDSLQIAREVGDALAYAHERETFGTPIIGHQAIAFKLADMATKVEASRLLVESAATRFERGERADLEAGMAKLFASETALEVATEAMRIHGGYGYTTDFPVERYFRDAPLMIIGEGTNEIQRIVIARALQQRWSERPQV